ncbi:MAG TPA: FG-GAP-like repeat-containing protein, partial [Rhizomicrobium sp.]|nr:FG-GAP-like repeat-containing protein [Rhizomicrobium sp.]
MDIARFRVFAIAWRVLSAAIPALFVASTAEAANAPAMIVPGQFNVGATGAFTYTIPIAVPPGTAGMVPALSLDYSSQGGDGLEGLGWSLSGLPSISRCPRTLAQDGVHGGVNFDANDRFCLEGQRLIAINNGVYGADGTEYRTEIDGFSRIVSHGVAGNGPAWFEVWTKSGQHMEFGHTPDSQAPVIVPGDPDDGGGQSGGGGGQNGGGGNTLGVSGGSTSNPVLMPTVRAWAVSKISDTVGNYLTITYDNGVQDAATGQVYPTRIDYTGNAKVPGGQQPYNSVRFVYTQRNDTSLGFQAGAFVTNTLLLTHVTTYAGAAEVSDYRLAYQYASFSDEHDELVNVTQCTSDQPGAGCLAPTSFTWQGSRDQIGYTAHSTADLTQPLNGTQRLTIKPNRFVADFDGDGIADLALIENQDDICPGTGDIYRGTGDGYDYTATGASITYDPAYNPGVPADCSGPATLYGGLTALFDFNADGITDIFEQDHDHDAENQYYILSEDGPAHFRTVNAGSRLYDKTAGGMAVLGDFDGDGRVDIFEQIDGVSQNAYVLHSVGDGTFTAGPPIGYDLHDDDSFLYAGDYDGDGCTDLLVQNHDLSAYNEIVYFCNPAVTVYSLPFGDWAADANHVITTGDFNGDGKTDVLLTEADQNAYIYLSTGTGLMGVPIAFMQGAYPMDMTQYSIVTGDFNADGKTDIALVPHNGGATYPQVMIYLSTGAGFVEAATYRIPSGDDTVSATASDWNNDGASDLWVQNAGGGRDDTVLVLDYTPELISAVSNGIGIGTYVTYDRLNRNAPLYTKCPNAPPGTYQCGDSWPTQDIDGPMYVVSRVDSNNGIQSCSVSNNANCYSSSYAYAGARADLSGRGFEGFSQMTVTDLETGVVQTTSYATQFPFTGMVLSQTRVANGAVISQTANTFSNGTGSDCSGQPAGPVYHVYLCRTLVQSWELGATPGVQGPLLPTVETDYRNYDGYGNVGTVTVATTPPGAQAPDVTKVTTDTWQNTV